MKVLIGCDVDPVIPTDPARRFDGDIWSPLEAIPRLGAALGDALPPITWLIRADDSIRALTGDFATGYLSREPLWTGLRRAGHELGWHMHVLRWQPGQGLTLDPEPSWLAEAHASLARHFPVRATRTGWDYGSDFLLGELARLGVRLDFSALPGNRVWVDYGGERLLVDWIGTPERAYRPARGDYRRPGPEPLPLVELPVTQFRNPLLGRIKRCAWRLRNRCFTLAGLGNKTRLLTERWDRLPPRRAGAWVFYFHPEDLAGDGLGRAGENLARLRALPGVEFVTASALAASLPVVE